VRSLLKKMPSVFPVTLNRCFLITNLSCKRPSLIQRQTPLSAHFIAFRQIRLVVSINDTA